MKDNMKDNKRNRQILLAILLVIGIISITVGVSVAFFNYTRTGNANTISVGRITFNSIQDGTINLTNVFPIANDDVATNNGNYNTVTISIEGNTDYINGQA